MSQLLHVCIKQGLGSRVAYARGKAIQWLEKNLKLLDKYGEPYEVAIVAYALMLSKASIAETAFGSLAKLARTEGKAHLRLTFFKTYVNITLNLYMF